MVGIKAGGTVFPGHTVFDNVSDTGFTAADFESIAVPCSFGPIIDISVSHRKTVLNYDRYFLRDEIPSIIGVPPRTASLKIVDFPVFW